MTHGIWGAALFLALAVPLAAAPERPALPRLDEENLAQVRSHILPTKAERRWQEIPWRTSFWSAVTEAQQKDKPILAWMMNGHPLACT